ncbi:RNA-guided endonuclease TnpB family protein [Micromonospora sp. NPDC002717]|uniref:RNA-guided endonuclease InsQ/TnpB family protein n=1 Tax=Micromonospora sp. NPDC002717 TaxID=3154424 RepID=UPI003319E10A
MPHLSGRGGMADASSTMTVPCGRTGRVRTAYRCRAYPTPEQVSVLNRTFGCIRVVWNRTLAARHARYRAEGRSTSYAQTDRALTEMKKQPDLAFLGEVSSVPLQQTLRHQHTAMTAFFAKRARYPRYKSRHGRQSASFTRSAFRLRGGNLSLGKTPGVLRFVWSWPDVDVAGLDPTMVTVCRDPDGRWFVTFAVDIEAPAAPEPMGGVVGVDLGLTDFAVLSTGERISHPKHMERRERRLKRYQRMMARRQKGSANRAKAKRKVARAHSRVRDARRDFLHQQSTTLVRRFAAIAVEDLAVANMVRNRSLARSISRTGWAEFRTLLTYKAHRDGRTLAVVDRWYPSSKTCSTCGHLLAQLSLGTRHWTCPSCGTRHDRDVNAAKNIAVAAGLAETQNACGADVRHEGQPSVRSAANQEPQPARVGIPRL